MERGGPAAGSAAPPTAAGSSGKVSFFRGSAVRCPLNPGGPQPVPQRRLSGQGSIRAVTAAAWRAPMPPHPAAQAPQSLTKSPLSPRARSGRRARRRGQTEAEEDRQTTRLSLRGEGQERSRLPRSRRRRSPRPSHRRFLSGCRRAGPPLPPVPGAACRAASWARRARRAEPLGARRSRPQRCSRLSSQRQHACVLGQHGRGGRDA